jgi:hypothetical protein
VNVSRELLQAAYRKALHQVSRTRQPGTNVFEREWDLLVIVDACRLDLYREAVADGEFRFGEVDSVRSLDSMTRAWMQKTFVDRYADELERTHYLCGNPFSSDAVDGGRLASLDEVWRYHWDDDSGTLRPRPLTDRAIAHGRERGGADDRLLVHYMQPHWPFLRALETSGGEGLDLGGFVDDGQYSAWENDPDDVWERLRRGLVSGTEVWEGYLDNLRLVLDDVELLLENYDAERAVISSDHGNAMGEWGIYGHPLHMPLSVLRRVPWVETSASDERTHEPDPAHLESRSVDEDVASKLTQLGYAE